MKFTPAIVERLRDTYRDRYQPESLRLLAALYWRTTLVVAFVLLVAAFFYGTWDLASILNNIGAPEASQAVPAPNLDRTLLSATLQTLDARQSGFDALKVHPSPALADPSK